MATSKVEVTDEGDRRYVRLSLQPVPAARPRVGKYGTFYPKTYATWKATAKEMLEPFRMETPYTHPTRVHIECIVSKPAKPARSWPRGDVDNYAKSIMDAVTSSGTYWYDDVCVTAMYATKRYVEPGEEPHITIGLYKDD